MAKPAKPAAKVDDLEGARPREDVLAEGEESDEGPLEGDDCGFADDGTGGLDDGTSEDDDSDDVIDSTFDGLLKIDTPTITNVVATYPKNPLCLGLYNPWTENWYTDSSIRCIYPDMGPRIGYAVTCVYGMPDPNFAGRLTFMDVVDALDAMKKPTILVIQQKWPDGIMAKAGLAGEIMVTTMTRVGCVGMISNGPSRDVDAVRRLNFQMLLGGVSAGHGEMAVQAVNVPVSVGGMDVAPGELIHMDENGAVKFPADRAEQVLANARKMLDDETVHLARLRTANSAAEIRALSGGTYSEKKK